MTSEADAEARGYARAVDDASRLVDESDVPTRTYLAAAIRTLSPAPADPVAEAAILLADHIDRDMNAANAMIDAYTNISMETPVRHWLSQCLRALAQKDEGQ